MKEDGTWPSPIIVLNNKHKLISPRNEVYGHPLHLLEGHNRLGYLRSMVRTKDKALKSKHLVYLVEFTI